MESLNQLFITPDSLISDTPIPGETRICGKSIEEFLEVVEKFHSWKAPALLIGGFMVDWAQELIGPGIQADAFVETCHCLPDAIQLLTPCTYGNGWMKVVDWDKFALILYDKKNLTGFRVWLDLEKTLKFPNIYNWYMRRVHKKDVNHKLLLDEILAAGRRMLSSTPVRILRWHGKKEKGDIAICPGCGEAYPTKQGEECLACQGRGYYEIGHNSPIA